MSTSVTSKFAGFLRGLIGRSEHKPKPATQPGAGEPATPFSQNGAAKSGAPSPSIPLNADEIELPLAAVVAGLSIELRGKVMAAPAAGQTIRIKIDAVISQLAFGTVRISFGDLRQLAPGLFVNSGGELDHKFVTLPLQEILPRLNPTLLSRRTAKKVEVAEEIVGPFAERGKGFSFTTQPLKAPIAAPAPAPEPEPEPEPAHAASIPFTPRQTAPPNAINNPASRSITPGLATQGFNGNTPSRPLGGASLPSRTSAPLSTNGNGNGHANGANGTNGHGPGHANGNGHSNGNGNGHTNGNGSNGHAKINLPPGLRLGPLNGNGASDAPAPIKMAPLAMATSQPTPAATTIFACLGDLCENWPESLRELILRSPMAQANVPLDSALIIPGLKRGRVVMTWKQIRTLAQPSSTPTPEDNLELELPLKVIAPLFLAAQKAPLRPVAKATVSAEIPDLFFGFPQAAPAPAPTPATPSLPLPSAPAAFVPTPTPAPAPAKSTDSNFYVWGEKGEAPQADEDALRRGGMPQTDFMSRQAHPKDVVARAMQLPGVAGAVVALQDGLRVASQSPADLNPDTLAAFLPQIFERLGQSTRELRMGLLNNVSFTVGNIPWKIFRVNAVYFAAFGRSGEQLPSSQLAELAAELDRKK